MFGLVKKSGWLFGVAASVLLTNSARAECTALSCDNSRILSIYTQANGDTYIQLSGTMSNLSCSPVSGVYVTLVSSDQHYKEIYANLLAWQLADRPVGVRVDQGSAGCRVLYVYTTTS